MEKYENEKGQIGVLVSCGFGAGWSTWGGYSEYLSMDKTIVEMRLRGATADEVANHIKKEKGINQYTGGWSDCEVEWLDKGTIFTIEEYDGSESIRVIGDLSMIA